VPHEQAYVVRMPADVAEGGGRPSHHVEAGAHGVGVVPEGVDTMLLRDHHGILFGLLDETQEEANG